MQAQELVHCGCIEYVDTEEEETTMIAMEIRDLCKGLPSRVRLNRSWCTAAASSTWTPRRRRRP